MARWNSAAASVTLPVRENVEDGWLVTGAFPKTVATEAEANEYVAQLRATAAMPNMQPIADAIARFPIGIQQNYNAGPTDANGCQGSDVGRGCLFLTGGLIQEARGAVGQSNGTGFIKRYSYDRCAAIKPPPYFPTTGLFLDNRYYEIDPVRFNVTSLFKSLVPQQ